MERFLPAKRKEWKENPNRKPLILKGVRQCGKTSMRPDTDGEEVLNVPLYLIGAMKNRIV